MAGLPITLQATAMRCSVARQIPKTSKGTWPTLAGATAACPRGMARSSVPADPGHERCETVWLIRLAATASEPRRACAAGSMHATLSCLFYFFKFFFLFPQQPSWVSSEICEGMAGRQDRERVQGAALESRTADGRARRAVGGCRLPWLGIRGMALNLKKVLCEEKKKLEKVFQTSH